MRNFAVILFSLAIGVAAVTFAQDSDEGRPELRSSGGARCEWMPTEVVKPSPQCGFNDLGVPNGGVYDCGVQRSPDGTHCIEHCVFKRCQHV